ISTYVVYTLDARTRAFFQSESLWWTSAFVILGVARFLYLVLNRPTAESPTQEMLKDGPFVAVVLVWAAVVMWMVYNLQPAG
ncbi:MAG: prenyltransferase UbiA, partial [Pseudomonadota bacterium]